MVLAKIEMPRKLGINMASRFPNYTLILDHITTWPRNMNKIREIREKNGGNNQENLKNCSFSVCIATE